MNRVLAALAVVFLLPTGAAAASLRVEPVADHVWAIVGPLGQRDAENLGNNATFGLIETTDGAVLIDPGGSAQGAAALAEAAATVTDQPIRVVVDTGGQDHRWLGNGWFAEHGAHIVASEAAVSDQTERADAQFQALRATIGAEALDGTTVRHADETFADRHTIEIGGVTLKLFHAGPAHTPGDTIVWLPAQRVAFTGDIVYMERLLGVMPFSDSRHWLEAFAVLEGLDPAVVVPGHGDPGALSDARASTKAYLEHLRNEVGAVIEAGGDAIAATKVDQGAFAHLGNFDELAGRNAQQVFMQMEWE